MIGLYYYQAYYILQQFQMATIFGGSRLANLRQKKSLNQDSNFKKEQPLKLQLFEQKHQKSAYQPSISLNNNNRTQTRLLKGRIERNSGESTQNFYPKVESRISEPLSEAPRPSLYLAQTQQFKLVINDEPKTQQKKSNNDINPLRTTQKRILIAKEPQRESSVSKVIEKPREQQFVVANPIMIDVEPEKPIVTNNQQKPIRQQQVEQSLQNQNELIMCSEGCGRKFHKKALERHAKACKLVFMSKRKEFNSEAKRVVNKEQASIAKQVKAKEKKEGKTKGFQKTGQNWKAASEDFRAAIKAIKKQSAQEERGEQGNDEQGEQKQLKIIPCQYCSKPFAEVFLDKHQQNCLKKKQSQKKKPNVPKKK